MPAVQSDAPFEHTCSFCGTTPTRTRKRFRTDKVGDQYWAGEYFSCDCYSLTVSIQRGKAVLNQTETCTNPAKLAA